MAKLRVLYDATLAANPAGTGTFVRGLLAALQQRSELELHTSSQASRAIETLDLRRKSAPSRLRSSLRHLTYYLDQLPREATRIGAELIFCPSALVPLRGSTPYVMTVFDLTTRRYPQTLDPLSRLYAAQMLRIGLRRSRAICTISQAVADEIRSIRPSPARGGGSGWGPPQPIVVAYPGPNPELMAAAPEPVAVDGHPFLLMVGTLEPRKNQLMVVRAFADYLDRHPDADLRLVLAGSPGWRYHELLRTIETSRPERVRVLGPLTAGQLKWLYQHARALLFPSRYEGFGLPVLEAFSLRCPVVAADIPPVREIAGQDAALLLDPNAPAAWTEAVEQLAARPTPPAMLDAAAARAWQFTWEKCGAAVMDALQQAASRR